MACDSSFDSWTLYYSIMCCGILSLIGCFLIVFTYAFIKPLQIYSLKLILYITISDMLRTLHFLLPPSVIYSEMACITIGITTNATSLMTMLWSLCISTSLYQVIIYSEENYEKYERYWGFVSWVFIPAITLLPLTTNSYGIIGATCSFKEDLIGNIWRLVIFFVPAWSFIIVTFFMYWKILWKIQQLGVKGESKMLVERVAMYPVIMMVVLIGLTVLRVLELYSRNSCAVFYVYIFSFSIFSLQGLLNSLIFFCTSMVKQSLKVRFGNITPKSESQSLQEKSWFGEGSTSNLLY